MSVYHEWGSIFPTELLTPGLIITPGPDSSKATEGLGQRLLLLI